MKDVFAVICGRISYSKASYFEKKHTNKCLRRRQSLRWLKKFPALSKTHSLMGHYNHSLPVDAKVMVLTNYPIIGKQVANILVAQ